MASSGEANELIGGHCQIGAWSLEDVVAVNAEELFVEVAMERPSLRVELVVASSLSHRKGVLVFMALRTVDVPVDTGGTVLLGFPFPWGAVDADIENSASTEGRERRFVRQWFWRQSP